MGVVLRVGDSVVPRLPGQARPLPEITDRAAACNRNTNIDIPDKRLSLPMRQLQKSPRLLTHVHTCLPGICTHVRRVLECASSSNGVDQGIGVSKHDPTCIHALVSHGCKLQCYTSHQGNENPPTMDNGHITPLREGPRDGAHES